MAGNDSYTKLLLNCDGTDGSTTFTDSSPSAHTVTANGDAQVDTAVKKFGTGSALFDGSGDYLTIPHSDDWEFGSGDFTIDFWVQPDTTNQMRFIARYTNADATKIFFIDNDDNKVGCSIYIGEVLYNLTGTTAFGTSMSHVALVRYKDTLSLYLNGTLEASETVSGSVRSGETRLTIGRFDFSTSYMVDGYMDEIRISKGIARWTEEFTPPAAAYSVPPSIPVISHLQKVNRPANKINPFWKTW